MPSPAENALPTSDRRHTYTRGGSTGDGTSSLQSPNEHPRDPRSHPAAGPGGARFSDGPSYGALSHCAPEGARAYGAPKGAQAQGAQAQGAQAQGAQSYGATKGTQAGGGQRDRALPPRTRRIVHVDVDAFLASVEQAVHPELAGKAVVVGGMPTDRNLVMSCSYPARAYGVKPGMMLAEAHRRCPHAIFRRGDSQAAKRLREATARILARATPIVEIASIDDFFADLTGTTRALGDAFDVAVELRAAIRAELALPVTIGIGTSRTLARLAGKLAKPGGVAEILPGHERAFLHSLPIEHLPGAGHVIGRMLERFGITRVGELLLVPREVLYASFGRAGLVLHERAQGRDPDPIEATFTQDGTGAWIERAPLSIRRDSTFEPEEGRREIVEAMFAYLVERAAHKLRAHRVVARSLAVRVQYVDTRPKPTDRPRESDGEFEKRARLTPGSDATDAIQRLVLATWRDLPRRRALVKRVGITLTDFAPAGGHQRTFAFDADANDEASATEHVGSRDTHAAPNADAREDASTPPRESRADRQRRIDRALDLVRERHGFGRILRGTSVPLSANHELLPDGFRLRTPSLNQ